LKLAQKQNKNTNTQTQAHNHNKIIKSEYLFALSQ